MEMLRITSRRVNRGGKMFQLNGCFVNRLVVKCVCELKKGGLRGVEKRLLLPPEEHGEGIVYAKEKVAVLELNDVAHIVTQD